MECGPILTRAGILEDWIKLLPQEEIEYRDEFAYQPCVVMRDRLFGMDVIREYGFDEEAARKRRDRHVPQAAVRAHHAEPEARGPADRRRSAKIRRTGRSATRTSPAT
jgi:hypothetical protein